MAGVGGKRPGAGRKRGVPNKATADIKEAFRKHGPELVKRLMELTKSENEQVRLGAINAAMDRGYGKARQPLTGDEDAVPIEVIHRVVIGQDKKPSQ